MKKKLLSLLLLGGLTLTAGAQYQVPNSDFEQWETVTYTIYTGDEPVSWNSFLDGTGGLKGTAGRDQVDKVADKRPGSTGTYSAKITARSVFGFIAQGNLTTGCVNMGSMTPTDASGNYNYSDTYGSKFQAFTGRPDAMRVWVKFNTTSSYKAKANAILHTAGYYQDPEANDITATVVAKAENTNIASTNAWQELTIPFSYNTEGRPAAALVSFATSNTPGKGNKNDYMFIDDLEFLYYSQLSDLKYNGATIEGFDKDTYTYSVSGDYTPGCLSYVKNCAGGEVVLGDYDEANKCITVTVKGDDISVNPSNYHTYTVTFVEPMALLTATFNGTALTVDAENVTEVDAVYSSDNWAFTTSGSNVRVLKKYFVDYGILSLIVMQFDADDQPTDKYKEYYYQFKTPEDVKTYNETLTVSFAGSTFTSTSPIKIAEMPDGTYILALSDFELEGLPVGDIVVDGLTKETINGIETFKSNGSTTIEKTIQLAPGNVYDYAVYLGPVLGDVPISMQTENYGEYFHTVIGINMEESLGYNIDVTAGTDIVAQTQSAALTETGEAHVVLNRQFLKGWNTICLPFATTPEAVAGTGAKAQAFAGAGADGLDFVVAETMTANTPYLIYVPADTEAQTFIANVNLEEATPASVKYGDFTFKGNYVANMPMTDLYGVADKDGVQKIMKGSTNAKLQGTRAYFDYSGTSSVSGMRINLEGQGDVTSIDGVQVLSGSFDIYNLQGIRVRTAATSLEGLTPGVYVVNGKKVMVK